MLKNVIFFFLILTISNLAHGNGFFDSRSLLYGLRNDETSLRKACESSNDCLKGFFCKLGDCVAKKPEGAMCLSGSNDECQCGECALDAEMFTPICNNKANSCSNNGVTLFNQCESSADCPRNYFCDLKEEKLCKSKLGPNRACYIDEMCWSNQCKLKSFKTRPHLPAIEYSVCAKC